MAQHRQRLAELERDTTAMIDDLTPASLAGQEHTDPLEYIEVLRDRRAINERFEELEGGSRTRSSCSRSLPTRRRCSSTTKPSRS